MSIAGIDQCITCKFTLQTVSLFLQQQDQEVISLLKDTYSEVLFGMLITIQLVYVPYALFIIKRQKVFLRSHCKVYGRLTN